MKSSKSYFDYEEKTCTAKSSPLPSQEFELHTLKAKKLFKKFLSMTIFARTWQKPSIYSSPKLKQSYLYITKFCAKYKKHLCKLTTGTIHILRL